jgi:hypothetical protein
MRNQAAGLIGLAPSASFSAAYLLKYDATARSRIFAAVGPAAVNP